MAKALNPVDIRKAVLMYYEKTELGNREIRELFGLKSDTTAIRLKRIAQELMVERHIVARSANCVCTDIAYESWGLDISDLEKRLDKIMKYSQTVNE